MDQANPLRRPPKRGIKKWICGGLFVSATVVVSVAYRHFTDPQRVRGLAEEYLAKITQRKVHIAAASFSLAEGIYLRDVTVTSQSIQPDGGNFPAGPAHEMFSCNEISILHDTWALLRGRLEVESFSAIRPTLTLVHDEEHGWEEVSSLLRSVIAGKKSTGAAPPIELREARVRLLQRSKTGERLIEDIHLTIRGRKSVDDPRFFNIVWQDANDASANGHSQIDLTTGRLYDVQGGLPTLSMRGALLAMDAGIDGAEELTQTMGLEGRVRARDFSLTLAAHQDGPRSVTIDLQDAAISVPVSQEERGLPLADRYLRFSGVSGAVTLTPSSVQADFDGLFHASRCKVSATVKGPLKSGTTLGDVSVEAKVSALSFPLPDREVSPQEKRFIERWPQLARFFATYDPHGKVDLDFRIEKAAGAEEKFQIREGKAIARGGDASCLYFPYRGEHLAGQVELGPDGLFVRDLCGNHDSAEVCVNGWMEAPTKAARAWFHVEGREVPINQELCSSLRPHQCQWIRDFGLAGAFNAEVLIERDRTIPGETPAIWDSKVDVRFNDISAKYVEAPIPVTHLAGRATVRRGALELHDAAGEMADGSIRLHGMTQTHEHGLDKLLFHVAIDDVRAEDELLAALPRAIEKQAKVLRLTSCLSASSDISFDSKVGWRHDTLAHLRNAELTPEAFPLPITSAQADLRIGPDRVDILRARGFYKNAELFAKGKIRKGEQDSLDLIFEAKNLPVDQQFRDAAPAKLRAAIADWRVEESIDTEIRLHKNGSELDWSGRAQLAGATVHHRSCPHPLHEVTAIISFNNDEVRCSGARAAFGDAAIDADFDAALGGDRNGRIRLRAQGIALDGYTRDLLPATARRAWDDASPAGRVDVTVDDLSFRQDPATRKMTWSVRGQAFPRNVQLGSDAAALNSGMIPFEGMIVDGLGGFSLSGRLQNADAVVYGQQLTAANAGWYVARAADGEGRAALDGFRGQIHGGTATSEVQMQFDERQANYRASTSIQDAALAPFLEAWRERNMTDAQSAKARESPEVRGTMQAQIHLAGTVGNLESRTGGGRVEIRNGYIYKLPIFMAILNVLDITVPNNDVLSAAFGRFFLTGNTVQLAQIEVTGESLSLSGSGTVSLADRSVDLTLFNAGAGRLSGVPVLAELWEGASRELVEIRVTGPVSQPQVRARPFRGVTDEFKKLFQKRKPKRNLQTMGS